MSLAFVFPGQGSQSVGMMGALAALSPVVEATFARSLGGAGLRSVEALPGGPGRSAQRHRVHAAGDADRRASPPTGCGASAAARCPSSWPATASGEFSALVAAGCLDFGAAVDLVQFRAEVMQAAVPQGRARWRRFSDSRTPRSRRRAARRPGRGGRGGQFQFAGTGGDRRRARPRSRAPSRPRRPGARSARCRCRSACRRIHSLMAPAAQRLRRASRGGRGGPAQGVAVYGVDVQAARQPPNRSAPGWSNSCTTPVHWAATVRAMIAAGATRIIECGPGKVLTSLNRRIDKNRDLTMLALEDPAVLRGGTRGVPRVIAGCTVRGATAC